MSVSSIGVAAGQQLVNGKVGERVGELVTFVAAVATNPAPFDLV